MDVNTLLNRLVMSATRQQEAAGQRLGSVANEADGRAGQAMAGAGQAGAVHISGSGQALYASNRARQTADNGDDIDSSSLPDEIKQMLKMIREIKARLREKQQELVAVMADQALGDDERKARMAAIQMTIGSLSGALVSATVTLNKLMNSMSLNDTQKTEVMKLMSK
ncbi:MAG: hypothetical protein ABN482_15460 [Corticimicrobacter sp.]|uniref:hypothetical protein n=1 Tax=Corticimicrobacter sp. TaxID=2678536 RepID=UPI0032DB513B